MPHALVNNIQIHYERFGSGPPLFLVGGYGQHKLAWKAYFDPLAKYFDVIAFDNRGAGQSDAPKTPYSIELFADDIAGVMDALEIKSAHFIGQSMGTIIIQQLCSTQPTRVNKAILCAPFAKLPAASIQKGRTLLEFLAQGVDRNMLLRLNASWMLSNHRIEEPGGVEGFLEMMNRDPYPQTPEGLVGQSRALFACDLRPKLPAITHPLLLLVGGQDLATPPYCADEILDQIQNGKLHTFKNMGHLFPWEIPDQVIEKAFSFLL